MDLPMLAYDLTEVLAGEDYAIDVDSEDVLAVLPQFLADLRAHVRADGGEVTW
ncbi:hypothetical protein [Amycolatopsis sp. NPDC004378]